jgi:hypothetical protein
MDWQFQMKQEIDQLAGSGRPIEAAWLRLRMAWLPRNTSEAQLIMMRQAFMFGAQNLFAMIYDTTENGDEEPTEEALKQLDVIADELKAFVLEETEGSA